MGSYNRHTSAMTCASWRGLWGRMRRRMFMEGACVLACDTVDGSDVGHCLASEADEQFGLLPCCLYPSLYAASVNDVLTAV